MTLNLWHTIRHTQAFNWDSFGDVLVTQAGNLPSSTEVGMACADIGSLLHVVVIDGEGKLWHTIRSSNAWQQFGDVIAATSNPGVPHSVACAGVAGDLHVVIATWVHSSATPSQSRLWHTIRHTQAFRWDSFGDILATQAGNPSNNSRYGAMTCADIGGQLHVVVIDGEGKLWHTIRSSNAWQQFGDVIAATSNPGPFRDVTCAEVGGDLHVVGLTTNGKLWHTIRHTQAFKWDPFGDVIAATSNPGPFRDVACAEVGGDLHVVGLTTNDKLWHTIRHTQAFKWDPFGDVFNITGDPRHSGQLTGSLTCAGVEGDLHVCFSSYAAPPK